MSLLAKTSSRSGFEIMKLTRRKMLTAMGVAVSSASFGKLRAADRIAPEPRQPAVPKAHDANVVPVCLADFEPLAKERLSHFAYEFIASGAADEQTIRWNREGFDQIRLWQDGVNSVYYSFDTDGETIRGSEAWPDFAN